MQPDQFIDKEPNHEASDYDGVLREISLELDIPEGAINDGAFQLAGEWIAEMRVRYGDPSSDSYNPYHNEQHALNIIKRSWQLWKVLRAALPERFDDGGFECLMLAGAAHDLINDPVAAQEHPGHNETESARLAQQMMLSRGFSEQQANRVHDTIIATTVMRDDQGMIIQSYIREGTKDPAKLVLAQADMNGIVMEGIPRMVNDAVDIYLETSDTPWRDALRDPRGAVKFFGTQARYLGDRIDALPDDLDHYFDKAEKAIVLAVYEEYFSGASRDAISAAKMLAEFPEVRKMVVESSFKQARTAAQHSLGQVVAAKRLIIEQLQRTRRDQ